MKDARHGWILLTGAGPLLWAHQVSADYALNMPPGVTPISRAVYALHMQMFLICAVIAALVFGILLHILIRRRKAKQVVAARFQKNTPLEIAWTLIPLLILVGMAVPATRTLMGMEDTGEAELTIKVTGYQWRWHYAYLDEGIDFFSQSATPQPAIDNAAPKGETYLREVDRPLVVPVNRKIRILSTANDVIHSWWVPALGMKKDALPGFINDFWARIDTPGVYRGQCAELCGTGHAFMPIVLEAKSEQDYQDWLAAMKQDRQAQAESRTAELAREWSLPELMSRGEQLYKTICAVCHQPTGAGIPGVFPPLRGSAVATGPLAAHIDTVLNGRPGTAMQAFGAQLSDADLAAVITYERNAFGNDTGDHVQPADIAAAR